ncbi:MAG: hypothetical protein KGI54_12380 [Pseudomonadota bacterium]|nr:hypothetical protein [Pseudomonadota bacterium]
MSLVISKDQANINREQGIAKVQESTEVACPGWTDIALNAVIAFAKSHEHFLTEEVREYCHEFVPEPRDARAWGAVIRRAVKTNIISFDQDMRLHVLPIYHQSPYGNH